MPTSHITVASQIFTLANFYLSTWEEYHTGVRTCHAPYVIFGLFDDCNTDTLPERF